MEELRYRPQGYLRNKESECETEWERGQVVMRRGWHEDQDQNIKTV